MCLDLYVHRVSRSMHLTELKQSDWVISALIINEFEKYSYKILTVTCSVEFNRISLFLVIMHVYEHLQTAFDILQKVRILKHITLWGIRYYI